MDMVLPLNGNGEDGDEYEDDWEKAFPDILREWKWTKTRRRDDEHEQLTWRRWWTRRIWWRWAWKGVCTRFKGFIKSTKRPPCIRALKSFNCIKPFLSGGPLQTNITRVFLDSLLKYVCLSCLNYYECGVSLIPWWPSLKLSHAVEIITGRVKGPCLSQPLCNSHFCLFQKSESWMECFGRFVSRDIKSGKNWYKTGVQRFWLRQSCDLSIELTEMASVCCYWEFTKLASELSWEIVELSRRHCPNKISLELAIMWNGRRGANCNGHEWFLITRLYKQQADEKTSMPQILA